MKIVTLARAAFIIGGQLLLREGWAKTPCIDGSQAGIYSKAAGWAATQRRSTQGKEQNMENKNTKTSKQTSTPSTQSIRSTPTSTRAPRMNTAEGIKELSGEIVLLDFKRTGRTIAECKADPSICAAEKALREKLRAFIRERLEAGSPLIMVPLSRT